MNQAVDQAARRLQSAYAARLLYPDDHPAVTQSVKHAFDAMGVVFAQRADFALLLIDDRVVCDDKALPCGELLRTGFFRSLLSRGIDQLTLSRGITSKELTGLVAALSSTDVAGTTGPQPSPHVQFRFIRKGPAPSANVAVSGSATHFCTARDAAQQLQTVWKSIYADRDAVPDTLGAVAGSIGAMSALRKDVLLPLAALKREDEYTFVHTVNVSILASALAQAVGLKPAPIDDLVVAALLHDIGKRVIPKQILHKPGRFTDEEQKLVRMHPEEGARILLCTRGLPELAAIVAYEHHLRLDGGGYPAVATGWRINLASQIVHVADVFDALRTHRSYKQALPLEQSIGMMREDAGPAFDAGLFEVFVSRVVDAVPPVDPSEALTDEPPHRQAG